MSTNPFQLEVREVLRSTGMPQHLTTTGPAPVRLGGEMLGVAEGSPIEVDADVSNLGESLLVDATVHGQATGQCSRCLAELDEPLSVRISDVFGINADFITRDGVAGGETEDDDDFEPLLVQDDMVDITQLVLDEVGLNLPFNPVCEDYGHECAEDTPAPDGISEEQEPAPDARWAGLAGKLDEIADEADSDDSEDGKN
ncbi:YceD family protein [Corynebacterium variabile]|uniref:YceD family protein n=1 Tax=Corynebacterium variabile TaxID=1727 RepID=UPI003A8F0B34